MIFLFGVFLTLPYAAMLIFLTYVWFKIPITKGVPNTLPAVSIIIPVRNESNAISQLLSDLAILNYPSAYEIILVDDHSDDNTLEKALIFQAQYDGSLTVVSQRELKAGEGKKAAIEMGVSKSQYPFVVTIDGDCRVNVNWLRALMTPFLLNDVEFVFGPVAYHQSTFWEKIQGLEFLSLIGVGGTTWSLGKPTMCNGANLSFRKSSFQEVGGYGESKKVASGDDEFLLHKMRSQFGEESIWFQKDPNALVLTDANRSLTDFYNQRRRWAGKWNMHERNQNYWAALGVFLFHLTWLVWLTLALSTSATWLQVLIPVLLKVGAEGVYLYRIHATYHRSMSWIAFLLWQCVYSLYAVTIGFAVQGGTFEWKGRKHRK